jgi:hypothetical protein
MDGNVTYDSTPILALTDSISRLGHSIHELQTSNERNAIEELKRFDELNQRHAIARIEDKLDKLTKAFATLQEDKAKMQELFKLVSDQHERLKTLSA